MEDEENFNSTLLASVENTESTGGSISKNMD